MKPPAVYQPCPAREVLQARLKAVRTAPAVYNPCPAREVLQAKTKPVAVIPVVYRPCPAREMLQAKIIPNIFPAKPHTLFTPTVVPASQTIQRMSSDVSESNISGIDISDFEFMSASEEYLLQLEIKKVKGVDRLKQAFENAKEEQYKRGYEYQIEKTHELLNAYGGVQEIEYTYNNTNRADILFNDGSLGEIKKTTYWGEAWEQLYKELGAYAKSGRNLHLYFNPTPWTEINVAIIRFRAYSSAQEWTLNGNVIQELYFGGDDVLNPYDYKNPLELKQAYDEWMKMIQKMEKSWYETTPKYRGANFYA